MGSRTALWTGGSALLVALTLSACDRGVDAGWPEKRAMALDGGAEPSAAAGSETPASDAQAAARDPLLPALGAEALSARYEAQRQLLGREGLFEDRDGRTVLPTVAPDTSVLDPQDALAMDTLDALPGSAGGAGAAGDGGVGTRANGNVLGLYTAIVGSAVDRDARVALSSFTSALRDLEVGAGDPATPRKVRVAVYGASHTQADVYPSYLRSYLRARFGNGGSGFIPLLTLNKWHTKGEWTIEASRHWRTEHAQTKDRRGDGVYGLLGATAWSANKQAYVRVSPKPEAGADAHTSSFELHFVQQPGGGKFKVLIDGDKVATLDSNGKALGIATKRFVVASGPHSLEVRPVGNGEVRLLGVVAENDQSGVVVDTLGIAGARAANQLKWDEATWAARLADRSPSLVILAYGTNETTDEDQPISLYRSQLREVLQRVHKAAPQASCVLVGPGDFPRQIEPNVWTTRPRLLEIMEVQREVALELGCGYWDAFAFMGGENSMHLWATALPQMASADHIHLSKRGYVRMGMALTDALMAGFDAEAEGVAVAPTQQASTPSAAVETQSP